MTNDPYRTLGVNPDASGDEIKAAYRKLARQYHPDVNGGSPEAERKMKQINEAYAQLMKAGKRGDNTATGQAGGYQSSGGYYGNYQSYGGYQGYSGNAFQQVQLLLQFGRYGEALGSLNAMRERTGLWYYLRAQANLGLGNRAAALEDARSAVGMEPMNLSFRQLLSRLEQPGQAYWEQSQPFGGMPQHVCRSPLALCCFSQVLCNCLSGGRFFCCI